MMHKNGSNYFFTSLMPLLYSALVVVLGGCMLGPNFSAPDLQTPVAWHPPEQPQEGKITTDPALVAWWTTFKDPHLESLIDRAVSANLDVRQARSRLVQARESRAATVGGLFPSLDLSGQARRNERRGGSVTDFGGEGERLSSGRSSSSSYQLALDLSWELDVFGGQRRSVEAAEAEIQSSLEDLRNTQVSLIGEVATRYVTVRGLQERLDVARKNLQLQEKSADIARRRYAAGFASALDVSNAEADLATTSAQIPALESLLRQEMYALAALLGREPVALVSELSQSKSVPLPPDEIPAGLPSELLRRRPDIRRAEALLHAETARIGVAAADLFPRLSLSAALGIGGDSVSALGNWQNRLTSLGGAIAQPIFDGGRRRANLRRQEAVHEEALLRYQSVVLNAFREVEAALTAFQKEQARHDFLETAVRSNLKARDTALRLYAAGSTDFLNVVSAERALFSAEDSLTTSRQAAVTHLIVLFKALGGGWEAFEA